MSMDNDVAVTFKIPIKLLKTVDKLAAEYRISRANTLKLLVERGIMNHGEPSEVTTTNKEGERRKDGVAITVNNELRKLL